MVDNGSAWWGPDLIRWALGWLEKSVYHFLGLVYEVFCAVANSELFSGETIYQIISKIQLILGIFMIFKLSMMIIKSMVNPDAINDKQNGASSVITRIVLSLVMLAMIMPLNIPNPSNKYEAELNNNGILFGTLYSLQKRVLEYDVLGQIILGNNAPVRTQDGKTVGSGLPKIKDKFITDIAKGFIRPNLKDEDDPTSYQCPDDVGGYNDYSMDELYEHLNDKCGGLLEEKRYAFAYTGFVGFIVGIVFSIIFILYTVEIAKRAIKLSILRVIAPIPIISYIEPGSKDKGAFASWVKTTTTTYIDLFIRLSTIYFVLFLIEDIMDKGLIMNSDVSGAVGVFTFIAICIGLLLFANEVVPFINKALGLQGAGAGFAGAIGAMLGGGAAFLGTVTRGGGLAKGLSNMAAAGYNAGKEGAEGIRTGKGAPPPLGNYRKFADKTIQQRTGDKNRTSGFFGAIDHWSDKKFAEKAVPQAEIDKQKALLGELSSQQNTVKNNLTDALSKQSALQSRAGSVSSNLNQATADRQRLEKLREQVKANMEKAGGNTQENQAQFSKISQDLQAAITKEQTYRNESAAIDKELQDVNVTIEQNRKELYDLDVRIKDETDRLQDAKDTQKYRVAKDAKFDNDHQFRASTLEQQGAAGHSSSEGGDFAGAGVNRPDVGGGHHGH